MPRVHFEGPTCHGCEEKLKEAHPRLAEWFRRKKAAYVNLHISWAYRGPADQAKAILDGNSKAHYPHSPHNHTLNGVPQALALDLFLIDEDGLARFPPLFYAKLNAENIEAKESIIWGGNFKSLGDANHFQLDGISAGKKS